jgi:hypothetical integral membrane protein (TIGR02206 family)
MNSSAPTFIAYSLSHWVVIVLMILISIVLILLARPAPEGKKSGILSWLLASVLILTMLTMLVHGIMIEPQKIEDLLPMHLCDWLGLLAPFALILRRQFFYEIIYFLGLAGTIQGVLTPDLAYGFPHLYFFTFFIAHCGIIIAVAYMTFGLKMRPYPISILRAFLFIQFYLCCAALVNFLLNTNFGYLREKPNNPSLLDHLGPWPWYLVNVEILTVFLFLLYYLPWWLDDRLKKRT